MKTKTELKNAMFLVAFGVLLFVGATHLPAVMGALRSIAQLLFPLLLGCLFAFVLNVPMSGLERFFNQVGDRFNKKVPVVPARLVALLITIVGIVIAFVVAAGLVIPELISSAKTILPLMQEKLPEWIAFAESQGLDLSGLVKQLQSIDYQSLSTSLSASMSSIMGSAAHVATTTFSIAGNVALGLVIAVYLLLGKHTFSRQALMLARANLSAAVVEKIRFVGNLICETYAKFLSGQFIEAIILGCLMYASFRVFGLPYAGLTAYLTGLCAFVPYVGAAISLIASVTLTLLAQPQSALLCVVVYLVTQFIENQFIYPRVVGGSVGLAPLWALLAALVGGKLFGVVGIVFFIPLASVVYSLIRDDTRMKLEKMDKPEAHVE